MPPTATLEAPRIALVPEAVPVEAPNPEVPDQPLQPDDDVALSALEAAFEAPEVQDSQQAERLRGLGRQLVVRGGVELVGGVVDAALIGAGKVGVNVLRDVLVREVTATVPEVAALDKFLPQHEHVERPDDSRLSLAARHAGNLLLSVTTAVVAQKGGIALAEHINSSLTSGAGEFAVPIASKVSALVGLSTLRRRISRRPA
jgi:hypothetical protein